jgi:multicomponent Na+:H+ antiporter subunit B
MTARVRAAVFLGAGSVLAALLGWAFAGLPAFGHYRGPYGFLVDRIALSERHTSNVVAGVVFDIRGVDTLGEEFILFSSILGVILLLRSSESRPASRESRRNRDEAARVVGAVMVGGAFVVGLWLAAFGYVAPGGGFQGGVTIASAILLVFLASTYRGFEPFGHEHVLDPVEALGAGGYALIGLAALVSGTPFLANLFSPGTTGTLLSGGSIPLLNWAVALEVSAAVLVLYAEFLEEYVVPLTRSRR